MSSVPRLHPARLSALTALAMLVACTGGPRPEAGPTASPSPSAHEGLNATLWVQTAAEYYGAAMQSYALAERMLEEGLADPGWSASLEQLSDGGFAERPPAVILDVDETVLDNSAFQARLIEDGGEYSTAIWNDWVREEKATPLPGALEFTLEAASRGVAVYYVTNRRAVVEEATRANLARYGFPLSEAEDRLLTRGEIDDLGDKTARRRHVAERYRILLLIGDNLGDFASEVDVGVDERAAIATDHAAFWGRRWIVLPNPQYGSWEGALFGFDYALDPARRLALKRSMLETERR